MTIPKVKILNNNNPAIVLGELEVADAYLYERVNDKYTFEIEYYEQEDAHLVTKKALIHSDVDDDYFRVAQLTETPIQNKYELTCEHVSYELNDGRDDEINAVYTGTPMEIANKILTDNDTRYRCTYSDFNEVVTFKTKTAPIRSRLIEFVNSIGAEIIFRRFEVSIVTRRGHDNGLTIELGKNLKDVTITKVFNLDGTISQSFDIDFIDLNKIVDANGNPLEPYECHLGDSVYLKIRGETIAQRSVAVGFNPFKHALPTIELDSPVQSLTKLIAEGMESPATPAYLNYWLSTFRIGNINCLSLDGIQIESPNTANIIAEINYEKTDEFKGLILALKEDYNDASISVTNQNGTPINYNNSTVLPNTNTSLIVTVTKGQEKQYYGLKFNEVLPEEPEDPENPDDPSNGTSKGLILETAMEYYYRDMIFQFTKAYNELLSVVVTASTGSVKYETLKNSEGKFTGIKINAATGLNEYSEISVQAVVRNSG